MTYCNNLNAMRKICSALLLLILLSPAANFLHAQTVVALPLKSYSNNGVQTLTPSIIVAEDQTQPPDIQILLNGMPLPSWLSFKESNPAGLTYQIDLFVPNGACVPRPTTATDCGTTCGDAIGPDYAASLVRQCHTIKVIAFGKESTHTLCVFGDPALSITTPATQNFEQQVGSMVQKTWSANRTSNLKWSLTAGTGVNSDYLTFDPGSETTQPTKLNYHPLTAEDGDHTLKVSGVNPNLVNPDVCDVPVTRVVHVKATDVPPAGGRVDLILVVDVSGSMDDKGACTNLPGTQYDPKDFGSKMGFVKSNLRGVYEKIVAVSPTAGSRVGFITFADNSQKKLIGGNFFNDIGNPATTTGIRGIIDGLTPTSSTNMGGALHDAIQELNNNSSAPKKQIILITNGMQNGTHLVRRNNGAPYIDMNNNRTQDAGENIPDNIQIFTIAIFQPSSEYLDLLKAISKTDTRFNDVCSLNEAIDEAFAKSYSNNSPKSVGYKRGNFSGNSATINYNLTEQDFDKILVSLSSTGNTTVNFTFEKNVGGTWTNITSGGTFQQVTPKYALFSIAGLPKVVNGVNITPQGQYRLVANSTKANADYFSSAIVDDRGLRQATFVQSKTVRAADTFGLSTRIRFNSGPVHQPNADVKAVIHRPVFSFEKLMAQEDVPADKLVKSPLDREKGKSSIFKRYSLKPADGSAFEAGLPLIEQKYQILVYHKALLEKLVWEKDTVSLPEISNGIYQTRYSNTKVTGLYRVEYLINGNVPVTGPFFRTSSHYTPVLFGKPDRSKSDFYLFDESGSYFLSLKPVDIYNNYLGMGKADQIEITMSIGSSNQPLDYLDGRYVLPLNVPVNQNPFVVITIAGMEFYRGYLLNIPQKRFFFGIQAGMTSPLGNFNTVADPGFFGGLKFGYRFTQKFGILAEAGYFSFKNAIPGGTNPGIFGGGAGLFFIPTSLPIAGGINVQLEATFGYYKPKDIDGTWGVRAGIDLGKYFKTWFSMSLSSGYYRINTSPDAIEFLGTALNAKFHF